MGIPGFVVECEGIEVEMHLLMSLQLLSAGVYISFFAFVFLFIFDYL
jgi:hypothetical protein